MRTLLIWMNWLVKLRHVHSHSRRHLGVLNLRTGLYAAVAKPCSNW